MFRAASNSLQCRIQPDLEKGGPAIQTLRRGGTGSPRPLPWIRHQPA